RRPWGPTVLQLRSLLHTSNQQALAILQKEIHDREKHHGDADHDENHHGGEPGLLPARPGDLLGFPAHLLEELDRRGAAHHDGRIRVRLDHRFFRHIDHVVSSFNARSILWPYPAWR